VSLLDTTICTCRHVQSDSSPATHMFPLLRTTEATFSIMQSRLSAAVHALAPRTRHTTRDAGKVTIHAAAQKSRHNAPAPASQRISGRSHRALPQTRLPSAPADRGRAVENLRHANSAQEASANAAASSATAAKECVRHGQEWSGGGGDSCQPTVHLGATCLRRRREKIADLATTIGPREPRSPPPQSTHSPHPPVRGTPSNVCT
jgi:hypothetical protein